MSWCSIRGEELNDLFFAEAAWRMLGTKEREDGRALLRRVQERCRNAQVSKSQD